MRSLILTEIKFLLPGWAIVVLWSWLVLVATPANDNSDYPLVCLGLGCALIAARAFSRAFPQPKQFSTERSSPSCRPSLSARARSWRELRISAVFGNSSRRGQGKFPLLGERDRVRAVQFSDGMEADTPTPERAWTVRI